MGPDALDFFMYLTPAHRGAHPGCSLPSDVRHGNVVWDHHTSCVSIWVALCCSFVSYLMDILSDPECLVFKGWAASNSVVLGCF